MQNCFSGAQAGVHLSHRVLGLTRSKPRQSQRHPPQTRSYNRGFDVLRQNLIRISYAELVRGKDSHENMRENPSRGYPQHFLIGTGSEFAPRSDPGLPSRLRKILDPWAFWSSAAAAIRHRAHQPRYNYSIETSPTPSEFP